MALLRMDATQEGLRLHGRAGDPAGPLQAALKRQGAAAQRGPVIVMLHGFRFSPGDPLHCPHRHILSDRVDHRCPKARSWPRALGVTPGGPDGALGIALGWPARGSIWDAYARAGRTGQALARLITLIHHLDPGREVHAIAHSLGVRVVLAALPQIAPGALGRAVLLSGAEYAATAHAALDSPAGRQARVLHVTSRENRPYDWLLERVIAPPIAGDRVMSRGLKDAANLATLHLDDPAILAALHGLGHPVAPRQRRVCHWSSYLRPGVFALYRALFSAEGAALFSALSRLRPQPAVTHPLPRAWPGLAPWGGAGAS
ncbi:alpha/beta hydrolase [Pseudooceanicola aestuarii]|uniref:alpha/beta hydrolase n=1 Tax=Pseudooceanicola aestuarii TaxID=2697319 RepID=UPI0013D2E12F|nr:alpha/beta hydrolase [Pseudooceanicola aestuarii]